MCFSNVLSRIYCRYRNVYVFCVVSFNVMSYIVAISVLCEFSRISKNRLECALVICEEAFRMEGEMSKIKKLASVERLSLKLSNVVPVF